MAGESDNQYLLPPINLSPEPQSPELASTWSPLDSSDAPDRAHIQYELADQHEDTPTVGLGILPSPGDESPAAAAGHQRTESNVTTATNEIVDHEMSDRPSRFRGSQSTLLDDHHGHPVGRCPTTNTIVQRRLSWIPLTIIVLAVYSTAFSGLYLVVAIVKPRYGRFIGADGQVAPSTANLLSALFAKTIELAYVTVCVAFLGQVLTRRAITKGSRGISISDMSMRSWIMQPGSLIVHWESLRYSALTTLGVITLTATLVAMLYTTAAEGLVSPKLVMGPVEELTMRGEVHASFANGQYLRAKCDTPVPYEADPEYQKTTCLDLQHVGQAYHDYQAYLQEWTRIANSSDHHRPSSTSLAKRPRPTGSLNDNTTVTGSWIDRADMQALSARYGRLVINVTAAMPHAGIVKAATARLNGIQQPPDLSGEGNYEIDASLPSPAINALCVGMTAEELTPIVYQLWPHGNDSFNEVTYTNEPPADIPPYPSWLNRTVVDDIFGFGPPHGQRPPIFGKLPGNYDTLLNTKPYNGDAIYLLGATPPYTDPPYIMCGLRAKPTGHCSTHYRVAGSGADLSTTCEDPSNPLQYNRVVPDMIDGYWSVDWRALAAQWATSLSLGTGITDGRASNSRLLMQLVPANTTSLSPTLPSISEALAVLAGSTLTMSTRDAPFVSFWNYSSTAAPDNIFPAGKPALQFFTAKIQTVGYASGGTQKWQGVFYIILVFAFVTSAICLVFLIFEVRGRQVTDFTDPQNLFALAMNSPATVKLQGACGAGPKGRQLGEKWYVAMEEDDEHYYIRTKAEENTPRMGSVLDLGGTPQSGMVEGMKIEEPGKVAVVASPAMDEYRRLSARRSFLSRWY